MIAWPKTWKPSPIGVDIGARSVKLLQLDQTQTKVLEFGRWQFTTEFGAAARDDEIVEAIAGLRESKRFRGRAAVMCVSPPDLVALSIRVPKSRPEDLDALIGAEIESRLPFPRDEAEVRHIDVGEVRQGESPRRELIVLACHRPLLDRRLHQLDQAGLRAVAVDAQPLAILRAFKKQDRRDRDQTARLMVVHVGASGSSVVIAQGSDVRLVKYVGVGGFDFDRATSQELGISLADATALRWQSGDRRHDERDPEIGRCVGEAVRPVVEELARELAMCMRYHSVTFRGRPIDRIVLSGSESSEPLRESLASRLDMKIEAGDPLRSFEKPGRPGRNGQWDVVAGLALRCAPENRTE